MAKMLSALRRPCWHTYNTWCLTAWESESQALGWYVRWAASDGAAAQVLEVTSRVDTNICTVKWMTAIRGKIWWVCG